jgi:ATP-dependent helicase HrpA
MNWARKPGDILIFMSGEREIRDTADALNKLDLRHTEVLPLYARLSNSEQNRVFQPHSGRRIVLATNVAETSLTVPGIKYVIDPGTARISRYSYRTKVQRLPIEPVSQASANQRKGAAAAFSKGSVFVSIPKTISCRARNLPTRKFCVPTWRRLFCR